MWLAINKVMFLVFFYFGQFIIPCMNSTWVFICCILFCNSSLNCDQTSILNSYMIYGWINASMHSPFWNLQSNVSFHICFTWSNDQYAKCFHVTPLCFKFKSKKFTPLFKMYAQILNLPFRCLKSLGCYTAAGPKSSNPLIPSAATPQDIGSVDFGCCRAKNRQIRRAYAQLWVRCGRRRWLGWAAVARELGGRRRTRQRGGAH